MKTFYATSVMTEVTIHGHAPPTYVGSAKSKVIHFGSAQTQEPWRPREMWSKNHKKHLHFKLEDNKAKPMMESIRATLSTTLQAFLHYYHFKNNDKRLHFKMEDNKAKPMMESIRATLSTTLRAFLHYYDFKMETTWSSMGLSL